MFSVPFRFCSKHTVPDRMHSRNRHNDPWMGFMVIDLGLTNITLFGGNFCALVPSYFPNGDLNITLALAKLAICKHFASSAKSLRNPHPQKILCREHDIHCRHRNSVATMCRFVDVTMFKFPLLVYHQMIH